jgi:23S rRNA-/tRNA-specific pseudouridylate synthase
VRAGGDGARDAGAARLRTADVVAHGARDAVVLKPAGLSSEAPGGGAGPATLLAQARAILGWPDAQLPHRLDRPTRGFVVVARDREAVAVHNERIRAGAWTKRYVARVRPVPGGPVRDAASLVGEHRAYLRREGRVARVVRSGGDPSRLTVEASAPAPGRAGEWHVRVLLGTGRYHQVRAMLAHLGAPLVGDADYGGAPGPMWLEHAWLSFPSIEDGSARTFWDPQDPGREPVEASLFAGLSVDTH